MLRIFLKAMFKGAGYASGVALVAAAIIWWNDPTYSVEPAPRSNYADERN